MITRNYVMYLEDIIGSIEKIEKYVGNLQYEDFKKNSLVFDAVIRNLEVIGEATKNIPEEIAELSGYFLEEHDRAEEHTYSRIFRG